MITFDDIYTNQIVYLSSDVHLREEHFGGLVFKKSNMAVYETNHLSYKLLKEIDGLKSLNEVILYGIDVLGGERETIEKVLQDMIEAEVIKL